ncbi:uncharacterized protein LAESUDRAFT_715317 [Laetiporus sulphureus 93-53]|uniref:Peptidase M60 domain-containing protein n=1 Tax=Laetiporus sulphureus 93-53 TaxID=1314785 RepID=A0A165DF46_9APHY|nr:uncharacterized protein LAESUDRAFT_715317 [Laetiporus sulphureus 93-53]KZT04754.1 hypothetical protein LAESUDRAFT_715317 [Laetiporus sulphureus 93-53]
MNWLTALAVRIAAANAVAAAYASDQYPLTAQAETRVSLPWDEPLSQDATGNFIFQALASLMQTAANAIYPNGHAIVPASIPPGTLLYHGRGSDVLPEMDWIAFDPEHSMFFAGRGNDSTLFTFSTTRELKLVYFDGSSGNKVSGVVDTQELLVWGEIRGGAGGRSGERQLITDACTWGAQYGIDGYVRMEADFEIMYCNFSQGLELVSAVNVVGGGSIGGPRGGPRKDQYLTSRDRLQGLPLPESPEHGPGGPPDRPGSPRGPGGPGGGSPTPPPGWKGSFPNSVMHEVGHAGAWHNDFPGELRVRVDPSGLISFFDPALTSLAKARRSLTRRQYRLLNISAMDIATVQADAADVFARVSTAGSGLDWQGLARVIEDRFSDRLPYLRYLLHQPTTNVSAHTADIRQQLITSLLPYMPRTGVGEPDWFAEIAHGCATRFTAHLPAARFTKQEHVLFRAVDVVLHEICRVLTSAWRDAFDVEQQSVDVAAGLLKKWKDDVDWLVEWLDWPTWMGCHPACGVDEWCYVPQHRPFGGDDENDHTPRCVSMTPPL